MRVRTETVKSVGLGLVLGLIGLVLLVRLVWG
jgi:hypothetical protein